MVRGKKRKRSDGEGTLRRRIDGRWEARVTIGRDAAGRPTFKYFTAQSENEVKRKRDEWLSEHEDGEGDLRDEGTTVRRYMERWLQEVARPSLRETTYRTYESRVRLHILPTLGDILLTDLQPEDVQRLTADLLRAGKARDTVAYVRAVLGRAMHQAERWGLIRRNPVALTDPPRDLTQGEREMRPFTQEELRAFLQAVQEDRLAPLYIVTASLGLRRGEALGLRWEDVDLDGGTVRITGTLQKVQASGDEDRMTLQRFAPKNRTSRRTAALPPIALAALRSQRDAQLLDRKMAGDRWHDTGYVFTSQWGTPLWGDNVTRSYKRALRQAGIPLNRFHDLRHTAATLLNEDGYSLDAIAKLLGHSTVRVTSDIYIHRTARTQRQTADRMQRILTGDPEAGEAAGEAQQDDITRRDVG